jgi:tRNA(adenine34) deaminase
MSKNYIEDFMKEAINLASNAYLINEVPVGALVVKDGEIVGRGHNTVIKDLSVSCHAEINAINDASFNLENYRLTGCDMYVSLEPCHMCAKAIVDARLKNLFFGAKEPKSGAIVSIDHFLDAPHLNHKVNHSCGYLEKESAHLLKKFFQQRRI